MVFDYDRPRVRHARIISVIAFIFDPRNNGEAHQGRAGPRPLAWRKTILCALSLSLGLRACSVVDSSKLNETTRLELATR